MLTNLAAILAAENWTSRAAEMLRLPHYQWIWAGALLLIGLAMLLFGVRLVRVAFTIVFAGAGAVAGAALAVLIRDSSQMQLIGAIGGAVVAGVAAFLLYRVLIILSFGAMLATMAGGVYLHHVASDRCVALVTQAVQSLATPADQAAPAAPPAPDADSLRKFLREQARTTLLIASLCAIGGLVLGVLIAAVSYRFAAIILTSLWGLKLVLVSLYVLSLAYLPGAIARVQGMGGKAAYGAVGLWLMGVAVQAAVARRSKPKPPETGQPAPQ